MNNHDDWSQGKRPLLLSPSSLPGKSFHSHHPHSQFTRLPCRREIRHGMAFEAGGLGIGINTNATISLLSTRDPRGPSRPPNTKEQGQDGLCGALTPDTTLPPRRGAQSNQSGSIDQQTKPWLEKSSFSHLPILPCGRRAAATRLRAAAKVKAKAKAKGATATQYHGATSRSGRRQRRRRMNMVGV